MREEKEICMHDKTAEINEKNEIFFR